MAVLQKEKDSSQFPTGTRLELPYFIATNGVFDRFDLAIELLQRSQEKFVFPIAVFKWNAAMALITDHRGDSGNARAFALGAIEAASIRESGLGDHKDVGLVEKTHKPVLKLLKKIVTNSDLH